MLAAEFVNLLSTSWALCRHPSPSPPFAPPIRADSSFTYERTLAGRANMGCVARFHICESGECARKTMRNDRLIARAASSSTDDLGFYYTLYEFIVISALN